MSWWMIALAVLVLAIGIWIGIGAPGWPHKEDNRGRRHREKRPINPISWGRGSSDRRRYKRR